jgi:hypothetical protein
LIFSSNWSGNICFANPGQTFKEILGMWVVPSVSQPLVGSPFQNAGTWSSVAWVGLDGAASADVFQAGTEQDLPYKIEGSPVEIYYAWTEWFPAPPVAITNFPVGPGDTVNVFLQITGEFELFGFDFPVGQALFSNQTRGTFTTVNMGGPENGGPNAFQGNSAEWIIETPCTANCSSANAVFTALPYFGAVAFYFAEVYDSTGAAVLGSSGSFVSMDTSGNGIGRNGGAPGTGTGVATPLPDIIGSVATNGG